MIKDKLLHDKLGIPQQTLQNWKNSDTYTSLLYKYLISQDKDRFVSDTGNVADLYNYTLLTPKEFSTIIEDNWDQFKLFEGYEPPETITVLKDDEEQSITVSYSSDRKSIILVRYAYAMSKKKESFFSEVERVVDKIKSISSIESFKIVYITSTHATPKFFSELKYDVTMVNYAELYERISDKHLLIV